MADGRDDLLSARDDRAKKKARLIDAVGKTGLNVRQACEFVGVSRDTFYRWRRSDAEFDAAMEAAEREGQNSALRRAIDELAAEQVR